MPRRSAYILLIALGALCLAGGITQKDTKETLVALAILIYAILSLATGKKKRPATKNGDEIAKHTDDNYEKKIPI